MAANDLNAPLRTKAPRAKRSLRVPVAGILGTIAVLVAIAAVTWVAVVDDPEGGYPVAVAQIDDGPDRTGSIARRAPAGSSAAVPTQPPIGSAALPQPQAPAAVRTTADPLDQLIEPSPFGPLPIVATDGLRPLDAYARPARVGPSDGLGRVVIIVGGLGLSQTGTQNAIRSLPPDVTLAFAPYGSSLKRWLDRAREKGHEILVQVPMEPFGYPQTDPGPQTLLAEGDDLANAENLEWILSRITSYTGVMNYLGANFVAAEPAMRWLLTEIADRGLMYVDDSTNARASALNTAVAVGAPAIRADVVLDQKRSGDQVAAQLKRLEQIAQSRGIAIGVASAFPTSVDAIAGWAAGAQGRGIILVPASAALSR